MQPWPVEEPGITTAVGILNDLILEAVASPELAAALGELHEDTVPQFATVNDKAHRIITEAGDVSPTVLSGVEAAGQLPSHMSQGEHLNTFSDATISKKAPVVDATDMPPGVVPRSHEPNKEPGHPHATDAGLTAPGESHSKAEFETEAVTGDNEVGQEVEACGTDLDLSADLQLAISLPEEQVFMEYVLENAIYGLVQESVLDDWDPELDEDTDQDEYAVM